MIKNQPAMQETRIQSLGWEDPLEKGMASHSSILAWRIPWTEEPVGLQSVGLQRVRHDWATNTQGERRRKWGQGNEYIRPLKVWALIWMKWLCWLCLHMRKRNLDSILFEIHLTLTFKDFSFHLAFDSCNNWHRQIMGNWTSIYMLHSNSWTHTGFTCVNRPLV